MWDHGQDTNNRKHKFCALSSSFSLVGQHLLLAPKTTGADKLHHGGTSLFPKPEDDSITYFRSYYCCKTSWAENQIISWDNVFHLELMLHREIIHKEILTLSLQNALSLLVYFSKQKITGHRGGKIISSSSLWQAHTFIPSWWLKSCGWLQIRIYF